MSASELDSRNIALSMRKSVENLVVSSQDAIGQSISQALNFSGVITPHTVQENKSVSRSPSPSLRHTESSSELVDDKSSDIYIQGSGDAQPVSIEAPLAKSDSNKTISQTPVALRGGADAGARTKKKSWYNALYPTYKSKSEDFKRLFKDLPDEERLIVDYSCALQKDILAHGRLYASQNFLCFYASIFGWETSMTLRWKDVTAITKEKTALVIPNAILVCTETEKNFLTSFSGRDKAYLMLFRIWQNALMDQPMSSHEIWQWVHSCYGEELGFNSEDEGYPRDVRDAPDDSSATPLDPHEELVEPSMEVCGGGGGGGGARGRDLSPLRVWEMYIYTLLNRAVSFYYTNGMNINVSEVDDYLLVDCEPSDIWNEVEEGCEEAQPAYVTNGDLALRDDEAGDTLPTDMSDTTDSEPDKHRNCGETEKCTSTHEGKPLLSQQFPFNIDQLFTMMFTNSQFNLELLTARESTDYTQEPWQTQGTRKARRVTYTLSLSSGLVGPKKVRVNETQVMNKCSKPGALYSIDATSENSGIPYADYFTVEVHYCLQRAAETSTHLAVYAHVRYKKTMWPMVKTLLENNTMSGLEEYARLLETRLTAAQPAPARHARRRRRHLVARVTAVASQEPVALPLAARGGVVRGGAAAVGGGARWLPLLVLALLLLNALLYWRLATLHNNAFDADDLQARMRSVSGSQMADWSRLLQQHTSRQRSELLAWRDALVRTVAHLAQTEQELRKLLDTIKPSLEKAHAEADAVPPDGEL
ncbi:PREDICTED: GRAM domain-containing protein 1B-like [Papilio xuthus]|uniref:GRAM domain-containing protein 1B-like n=1 Tax=Papilio xuthus TaxID=66420 RepID=A0AAJ7E7C0_PAPXU|nr:PREDICTED: GRAM domain-containing protein 1B-like [Papilio xuthus]